MVRKRTKAQVSLELSIALIGILILLFGAFNVFMWVNKRMVQRQKDYESSRVSAGSAGSAAEHQVNETRYPTLNILKRR